MKSRKAEKVAFDFSNVPQGGSNNNAELAQMQEGTMLICRLSLPDRAYSDMTPAYLVKNSFDGGLINWSYDLQVLSPAMYAGRVFEGKKPVTYQLQLEKQVNVSVIKDAQKKCIAGDRVVAGVLAFDADVRCVPRKMSIDSYDDLEGKICAVQVAKSPQGTKYLQFLSPLFAKEQMTCEMLAQNYRASMSQGQQMRQPMPQQMPPMQPWGANTAPQSVPPAGSPQAMQQQMQQMPPPARIERSYPAQQSNMAMQQPMPNNGWPQPADDDIPF